MEFMDKKRIIYECEGRIYLYIHTENISRVTIIIK